MGRTELWSEVGIGAIYSTLRRMHDEGLVRVVRSEREGQLPERTIYAITEAGRKELSILRASMLRDVVVRADPFDLAFACSADIPTRDLLDLIADRTATLRTRISSLEHLRVSSAAHLDTRDELLFDHLLLRLRADLTWHEDLASTLSAEASTEKED